MRECVSHLTHNVTAAPGQQSLVERRRRVFKSTNEEMNLCAEVLLPPVYHTVLHVRRVCVSVVVVDVVLT